MARVSTQQKTNNDDKVFDSVIDEIADLMNVKIKHKKDFPQSIIWAYNQQAIDVLPGISPKILH